MPRNLSPELKQQLAARVDYYREMGIYDFYRQPVSEPVHTQEPAAVMAVRDRSLFDSPLPLSSGKRLYDSIISFT